ncbi:MAG: murein biosynthesis integral membrane protein MurJ [bacterium]
MLARTMVSSTWAAVLLGVASLASRFLGMFRDRLLSGTFGAGPELDAYYAAFRAPDFMFGLFVSGAISVGFIPVFTRYVARGDRDRLSSESSVFASRVITVLGLALAAVSAVGAVTAHWFVPLYTGGFEPEFQRTAVGLTRIMLLSPFFLGLSAVFSGVLQTYRRFGVYSLAPVVYNLGIISGTLFLTGRFGVYGVALGVVVGSFLHMAIQLWSVLRLGFRFSFLPGLNDRGLREIIRMMGPRTASLALEQANLIVLTGVATTLTAGSVSVFSLANNLQSLPVGVLGISFAVASFPFIAELAERNDLVGLRREFSRIVQAVLFLILPATVALLLLRAQVVRVVLGTGQFDWAATEYTADALALFALSLFAQALLPFIVKIFFAFRNVRLPLVVASLSVVFERLLAWQLVSMGMGLNGLVLALSVSNVLRLALLWALLRGLVGDLGERKIVSSLRVIVGAGAAMGIVMQGIKVLVGGLVDMHSFVGIFTQGALAGSVGLAVYLGVAYLLGNEEARRLVRLVRRRVTPVTVSQAEHQAP